jgi:hypothetical protein
MSKRSDHAVEDCDVEGCEFHETCSLCTTMTPIGQLRRCGEWEMVCPSCRAEARR